MTNIIRIDRYVNRSLPARLHNWLCGRRLIMVQTDYDGRVICLADSGEPLNLGPLPRVSTLLGLGLEIAKIVGATHIYKWESPERGMWRVEMIYKERVA